MGEEAVAALEAVHGTVFDPINSADLCKLSLDLCGIKNCEPHVLLLAEKLLKALGPISYDQRLPLLSTTLSLIPSTPD